MFVFVCSIVLFHTTAHPTVAISWVYTGYRPQYLVVCCDIPIILMSRVTNRCTHFLYAFHFNVLSECT